MLKKKIMWFGKQAEEKPKHRRENDIADIFGTMTTVNRITEDVWQRPFAQFLAGNIYSHSVGKLVSARLRNPNSSINFFAT